MKIANAVSCKLTSMDFTSFVYALTVGAVIIALATWNLNYWKKKNVPGPTPLPLFGNFAKFFFKQLSNFEIFTKLYNDWRSYPFFGIYMGPRPVMVINDLDLVKNILTKDFHIFSGRGLKFNENVDPLLAHLFILDGPRWKYLRSKLSPIFTTGKLKHMFDLILECADDLEMYLHNEVKKNSEIDCTDLAVKFTTNVIGSCAFGVKTNAFENEDSEFRQYGKMMTETGYLMQFKVFLSETAPKIFRFFQVQVLAREITDFFISLVRETVQLRKRESFVRNDLIDILMEIKRNHDVKDFDMTDGLMAAQAFVFFFAGSDTSSAAISFTLLELAHRQDIQEKLRREILEYLHKHNGKVTYDSIKQMTYLDCVFQEVLRKHSPATFLERQAEQPYTIPNTDVVVEKGCKVIIPVYAIQHDPKYYPDPEVFDPERFTEEAKRARHPMAYLPFGDGPKNCIGARFAVFQVKLGLIKVLKNYHVTPTKQSALPYDIDKNSFILKSSSGIHLKLEPLQKIG